MKQEAEEVAQVSALTVTPAVGKGLRTLGGFPVRVGGRLDKTGVTLRAGQETRALGQRWGKVESALLIRRRSHSLTGPRCLRAAPSGRTTRLRTFCKRKNIEHLESISARRSPRLQH
jgi:hypothetical protein